MITIATGGVLFLEMSPYVICINPHMAQDYNNNGRSRARNKNCNQ